LAISWESMPKHVQIESVYAKRTHNSLSFIILMK
jgi:hypothetical protein